MSDSLGPKISVKNLDSETPRPTDGRLKMKDSAKSIKEQLIEPKNVVKYGGREFEMEEFIQTSKRLVRKTDTGKLSDLIGETVMVENQTNQAALTQVQSMNQEDIAVA